jgi:hypothetical protein
MNVASRVGTLELEEEATVNELELDGRNIGVVRARGQQVSESQVSEHEKLI